MVNPASLSIAFIERRPAPAANVLSSIEPGDAAAFLDAIPARFAARAISHMGPWHASLVITGMSGASGAAVLKELNYSEAAAILRLLPLDARTRLLNELPGKLRHDFETSLSFPADTVGAHMSMAALTLGRDHTVADAEDLVRQAPGADAGLAFIVDHGGKFAGVVTAAALLRYPAQTALGDMMAVQVAPLSARARLAAVVDVADWDDYTHLPVVSRQKQVIGMLSRKVARQALNTGHTGEALPRTSVAASMAESFFISAFGLARLLADVNRPIDSSVREGDRR